MVTEGVLAGRFRAGQKMPSSRGLALHLAFEHCKRLNIITRNPLKDQVAAISCGIYQGVPVLDLDYDEDSKADADANFVLTASGGIVEIQGTAEGAPFSRAEMDALIELAQSGIRDLIAKQRAALGAF